MDAPHDTHDTHSGKPSRAAALLFVLLSALHCGAGPSSDRPSDGSGTAQANATAAEGNGDAGAGGGPATGGSETDAGGADGGGTSLPAQPLPKTFSKRLLDTTKYPNAVCNDGSPAGYYAEAGASASAPWVLLLDGGSWCGSDADCVGRASSLSSSKGWPSSVSPTGILSGSATGNPHFATANRIEIPYCTSDVFSGNTGPTGGKTNFSFRGVAVLALLRDVEFTG